MNFPPSIDRVTVERVESNEANTLHPRPQGGAEETAKEAQFPRQRILNARRSDAAAGAPYDTWQMKVGLVRRGQSVRSGGARPIDLERRAKFGRHCQVN